MKIKNNSNFHESFDQLEQVFQVLFVNLLNLNSDRIREKPGFVVSESVVEKSQELKLRCLVMLPILTDCCKF